MKKWKIAPSPENDFFQSFPEFSSVALQLLHNRGLKTQDEIDVFLGPDYYRDQNDPFLFSDMKGAVTLVSEAIKDNRKIAIHGDYDADGVTSTAVLYKTLEYLGAKNILVYIPHRMTEGYGLGDKGVEYFIEQKVDLVITVDCGISSVEEVATLRENGMNIIITDHHKEPEKLPRANYIICPTLKKEKYPFSDLAGVGVAFRLASALLRAMKVGESDAFEKWLLDLVAVGTIADCMPLLGENRVLVKWGLVVLEKTKRLGLKEILSISHYSGRLDANTVGFQIAPRLNAAGRMDHANSAFALLATDDEMEALALSGDLDGKNQDRQKVTEKMLTSALEQIGEPDDEASILFALGEDWSAGLVGLVAGRLSDRFHRPVIVFGREADGGNYVASGRSIPEFDITEALRKCDDFLLGYGGHSQACGLTIEEANIDKFQKKMLEVANQNLRDVDFAPTIDIDASTRLIDMDWSLIDILSKFAPYGEGNPEPIFVTEKLMVDSFSVMGKTSQHLRLDVRERGMPKSRKFVGFGLAERWVPVLEKGNIMLDIVYNFGVNEWNGNRELQFKIIDMKLSK